MTAKMIFVNGNIVTMDPSQPRAEAVAVQGNRIQAVGDSQTIRRCAGKDTEVVDLAGRTLLPGFSDNHLHLLAYGIAHMQVRLYGAGSVAEAVERVRAKALVTPPGKWVLGRGWDQNHYREGRYPNRYDLDQAAPNRPVALTRICGHLLAVNSKALELAGITRDTPDPEGGRIDRDENGEPTGILRESSAMILVRGIIPAYTRTEMLSSLQLAMEQAAATGITAVTTDDVRYAGGLEQCLDLYRSAWAAGGTAVRSYLLIAASALEELLAKGLKTGDGDDQVRIGSLKILQDGSLGARTAVLLEPYTDEPDNCGVVVYPQDTLNRMVSRGHAAGMQVAIHAIGDGAVVSCLDAFAVAQAAHPRTDSRHRIIHYSVVNPAIIARTREMGVIADMQPKFVTSDGGWLEERLGAARCDMTYPFRTILDSGIVAVGGSDCPVEPFAPLQGIQSAVTRRLDRAPRGTGWRAAERITPFEALQWYTINGAYSNFEEANRGSLAVGKLADLVVLAADPMVVPAEEIQDIPVELTVIDGQVRYVAG